jgi:hypothetical protein
MADKKKQAPQVFVANNDALLFDDEHGYVSVRKNVTRVVEGHPLLEQHPDLFQPADQDAHFSVRTAREEPAVVKSPEVGSGAKVDESEAEFVSESDIKIDPRTEETTDTSESGSEFVSESDVHLDPRSTSK